MAIQKNPNWWVNPMAGRNLQALDIDCSIIFKTYFKDLMGSNGLGSSSCGHRPVVDSCEHVDEISSYIKLEELLYYMSGY